MKSVSRCHINLQQQCKSSNDRQSTQTFQKNIVQRLSQTKQGKKLASPKTARSAMAQKKRKQVTPSRKRNAMREEKQSTFLSGWLFSQPWVIYEAFSVTYSIYMSRRRSDFQKRGQHETANQTLQTILGVLFGFGCCVVCVVVCCLVFCVCWWQR